VPDKALSTLGELRRHLEWELNRLRERQLEAERTLQAVGKDIEYTQGLLELVEATQRQLAEQGRGEDLEGGWAPEASEQVRALPIQRQAINESVWPTWGVCCDSRRQRVPSSGPYRLRPTSRLSLSRRGPSPWWCGRTTCSHC
jgi:hypothetical protein